MTTYDAATCGKILYGAQRCASLGHPPGGAICDMQDRCPDFTPEKTAPHVGFMSNFNLNLG